jgi:hypothetical protein
LPRAWKSLPGFEGLGLVHTVIALLTAERPQPPAHDSWITGAQRFSRFGLPDELP